MSLEGERWLAEEKVRWESGLSIAGFYIPPEQGEIVYNRDEDGFSMLRTYHRGVQSSSGDFIFRTPHFEAQSLIFLQRIEECERRKVDYNRVSMLEPVLYIGYFSVKRIIVRQTIPYVQIGCMKFKIEEIKRIAKSLAINTDREETESNE